MAFTVQQVVDFARRRVIDTIAPYRYSDSYYIDGINQGLSTMLEMKPELFAIYVDQQLATGVEQTIEEGVEFLSLSYNLGADGSTTGSMPLVVEKAYLDASLPGWTIADADGVVDHYFMSPVDRRKFFVYPPQPEMPHYVRVGVAKEPAVYTAVGETITEVDNHFLAALGNFAAAFVLMTDDENPATTAKVQMFQNSFLALIGPVTQDGEDQ